MQKAIKSLVESNKFVKITSFAIIGCSILLGVETFFPPDVPILVFLDWTFALFFMGEIVLRMIGEGSLMRFFTLFRFEPRIEKGDYTGAPRKKIVFLEKGFWNWFDFIIVLLSSISLFAHLFDHPEFLIVSRLFRVLRILRLLEISDELKAVEKKIISIIPTVFSFALLLGILLYIYSIIGIYLFSHHKYEQADFRDLGAAFLTLFQMMTLEGWPDMMYASSEHYNDSWFIKGYFVSFILLTVIVSFNVFVAVLTSQVQEKLNQEKQAMEKEAMQQIEDELNQNEQEMREGFRSMLVEMKMLREELANIRDQLNNKP
jgi:large-conductance mechanosensitive channel